MYDSIQEIADSGGHTFTDVVLELLRQGLSVKGYTMGIGRDTADGSQMEPSGKQA
jgi:hypothetical protein